MFSRKEIRLFQLGIELGKAITVLAGVGFPLQTLIDEERECAVIRNILTGQEQEFMTYSNLKDVKTYLANQLKKVG